MNSEPDKKMKNSLDNDLTFKAAMVQVMVSLLANASVISMGMGLGYPAITTQLLLRDDAELILTPSQVSWFASVTAIASPFGGPLSGFLTDSVGRRNTLAILNIFAIASWLIIGFSSRENVEVFFIQLMIGRALIGLLIGMITTPAVMYSSEICHLSLRGRLTIMSTPFFMAFGVLIAYFLGYLIPENFRLVAIIAAVITSVTIVVLMLMPESPVFLVAKKKTEQARKVLSILRQLQKNDPLIDAELEALKTKQNQTSEKVSLVGKFKMFQNPELYKPFLIMFLFFFIQQFSGIFTIFVYAAQFSLEAGVVIDEFLSTVIVGVIRCVATVLIAFASDKYGRRPLVIVSGVGMFICMTGLAICSALSTSFAWLPATFLYIFVFIGTIGILSLPFAMVAEMFPQKIRGFASGITMSLCFIMSFANIKTFSTVFEYFGNVSVFSFYAAVSLVGVIFGIFILPETKGKSLQEIEEIFRKK